MENKSNEINSKPIKQTLFDETNITIYEVKRHSRGRGRTRHKSHHHRVHPRRSLSQGATPRSRHPLLIRQPLAPQRRLSVSKLKLNNNYSGYQKSSLICLSIVSFTSMLAMSLIAPFFPLEASMKGMRETIYGFVFSVYALVIMIMSPISGKLVPILGAKFMLVSGVFVAGVANILFGVLDKIDDLPTFTAFCFIVRTFEALGAAAFSVASYTIIMQVFPDNIGTAFVSLLFLSFYLKIETFCSQIIILSTYQSFSQLISFQSQSSLSFHVIFIRRTSNYWLLTVQLWIKTS